MSEISASSDEGRTWLVRVSRVVSPCSGKKVSLALRALTKYHCRCHFIAEFDWVTPTADVVLGVIVVLTDSALFVVGGSGSEMGKILRSVEYHLISELHAFDLAVPSRTNQAFLKQRRALAFLCPQSFDLILTVRPEEVATQKDEPSMQQSAVPWVTRDQLELLQVSATLDNVRAAQLADMKSPIHTLDNESKRLRAELRHFSSALRGVILTTLLLNSKTCTVNGLAGQATFHDGTRLEGGTQQHGSTASLLLRNLPSHFNLKCPNDAFKNLPPAAISERFPMLVAPSLQKKEKRKKATLQADDDGTATVEEVLELPDPQYSPRGIVSTIKLSDDVLKELAEREGADAVALKTQLSHSPSCFDYSPGYSPSAPAYYKSIVRTDENPLDQNNNVSSNDDEAPTFRLTSPIAWTTSEAASSFGSPTPGPSLFVSHNDNEFRWGSSSRPPHQQDEGVTRSVLSQPERCEEEVVEIVEEDPNDLPIPPPPPDSERETPDEEKRNASLPLAAQQQEGENESSPRNEPWLQPPMPQRHPTITVDNNGLSTTFAVRAPSTTNPTDHPSVTSTFSRSDVFRAAQLVGVEGKELFPRLYEPQSFLRDGTPVRANNAVNADSFKQGFSSPLEPCKDPGCSGFWRSECSRLAEANEAMIREMSLMREEMAFLKSRYLMRPLPIPTTQQSVSLASFASAHRQQRRTTSPVRSPPRQGSPRVVSPPRHLTKKERPR